MRRRSTSIDFRRRTALYRLYDADGRLLYVGVTFNPRARWLDHSSTKAWWHQVHRREVEWHSTRSLALAFEAAAIVNESPLYNVAGTDAPPSPAPRVPGRERTAVDGVPDAELAAAGKQWRRSKANLKQADADLQDALVKGRRQGIPLARLAELSGYTRDRVAKIAPSPKSS